jgi:hypothetical protein
MVKIQDTSLLNFVTYRVKTEVNRNRHKPNNKISYSFSCSSTVSIKYILHVKALRVTSQAGVAWQRYMLVDA